MQQKTCRQFLEPYVIVPDLVAEKPFKGFCHQSSQIEPGQIFLAFPGKRAHGIAYAEEAMAKGAIAIIAQDIPEECCKETSLFSQFMMTTQCLKTLLLKCAKTHRDELSYPLIAITGSVGKTTLKSFAQQFFGKKDYFFSKKNWNNELGLLINLCSAPLGVKAAFFECGISEPGEMKRLEEILQPESVLITCFAESHLSLMKTLDNVVTEKLQLAKRAKKIYLHQRDFDKIPRALLSQGRGVRVITHQEKDKRQSSPVPLCAQEGESGLLVERKFFQRFQQSLEVEKMVYQRDESLESFDHLFALLVSIGEDYQMLPQKKEFCVHLESGRGLIKKWKKNIFIADHSYNCSPQSLRYTLLRLAKQRDYERRILLVGDVLEQPESVLRHCFSSLYGKALSLDVEIYVCGSMSALWPKHVSVIDSLQAVITQERASEKTLIALTASRAFAIEALFT